MCTTWFLNYIFFLISAINLIISIWTFHSSQLVWLTNCNQGRCSARSVGGMLTAGFRNVAVPSHCCWQEISARHWCAAQELIWSSLLQQKGTCSEPHYGEKTFLPFLTIFLLLVWNINKLLQFSFSSNTNEAPVNVQSGRLYFHANVGS